MMPINEDVGRGYDSADSADSPDSAGSPTAYGPQALCDMHAILAEAATDPTTVLWRLAETGRQLDANLVHLAAGDDVGRHAEPDLDVLLVVVAGTGTLRADDGVLALTAGVVMWLPRGSARSLAAGAGGLSYLTVHARRPGMRIRPRPETLPPPPPRAPGELGNA